MATIRNFLAAFCIGTLFFSAAPASGQALLTMRSDPGDYIGAGATYSFSHSDGPFTLTLLDPRTVQVGFHTPSYSSWWYLEFSVPPPGPLAPGSYPNATRWPFQSPLEPGLSVIGDGRGCNQLTGSFEIADIKVATGGVVTSFEASFEQHCEGSAPALRGTIRYGDAAAIFAQIPALSPGVLFALAASVLALALAELALRESTSRAKHR